ncbi:signal peptidase I [Candidatus Gracilibacteria bacterium]|nr:signal peptidase I [Candidatus Gracilibacteria bacterium]MBS9783746.1 signal peptidase I [Candidatus Gracilibacteria bacterium]
MSDHSIYRANQELRETNSTFMDFIKFLRDFVILLIIVLLVRSFIVTPFRISGSSMEASYHDGEYILIDKFSYLNFDTQFDNFITGASEKTFIEKGAELFKKIPIHIGDPKRGDVVVITPHVDPTKPYYIKRIVGMPGDTIRFENGKVSIKKPKSESFIELSEDYLSVINEGQTNLPSSVTEKEFKIPQGFYWVMGDNRLNSADSRSCFHDCFREGATHFAARKDIIGRVLLDFGHFDLFDGEFSLNPLKIPKLGTLKWLRQPRFFDTPRNAEYPELK